MERTQQMTKAKVTTQSKDDEEAEVVMFKHKKTRMHGGAMEPLHPHTIMFTTYK
jgi:hypothetical protein